MDDLRNCTNLGMDRLAARVRCRMNVIQPDIHAARRQHIPVAGRMSKDKKTEERRASLKRTSVTCKRITEMALASAAKNYTRQGMEAVRLARRPEAITNRKRESDVFQEDVAAKLKHSGSGQEATNGGRGQARSDSGYDAAREEEERRWQASAGGQDKRCEGRLH